jgi:hypothetical protein
MYKKRDKEIAHGRKTYIEIHIGGVHFKPFLIHQLKGYAVKNVKSSIIFWKREQWLDDSSCSSI